MALHASVLLGYPGCFELRWGLGKGGRAPAWDGRDPLRRAMVDFSSALAVACFHPSFLGSNEDAHALALRWKAVYLWFGSGWACKTALWARIAWSCLLRCSDRSCCSGSLQFASFRDSLDRKQECLYASG